MGHQRGSALTLAILVLVVLSGLGIALLSLTETEMKISRSDLRSKQAFAIAEAGIEHARLALFAANEGKTFDDDLETAAGGSSPWKIDFDPEALEPTYDDRGVLSGFSAGVGDDVPLVPLTPLAGGAYMAFLTNDPVESIGIADDTNGRVMLTGIGGNFDRSLEIVQAIIEFDPVVPQAPPAALSLLGPPPQFQPGPSSAKLYDGNDCGGSGIPGLNVPTIGVIGTAAASHVRDEMGQPTYESGTLAPEDTIADLTDLAEPAVSTEIDPLWTDCPALKAMIEEVRDRADIVCTSPSCSLPPVAPDRVVFVDGDYDLHDGSGLLVVTGRLTYSGAISWTGLLLVVGEGILHRAGGGADVLIGAVVVADIAGPDQIYGTADDCTGGHGGFDRADFRTLGGGASTVGYCNGAIGPATPHRIYKITQFLQR